MPKCEMQRLMTTRRRRDPNAAARMRKMRRLQRADLMRFELYISRRKLRKITAARAKLSDDADMPDALLRAHVMKGFIFLTRLWLRRHESRLRVTH